MAKVIVVRVPFTDPKTKVEYRRGDIIGHPDRVAAHHGSEHEHHGHATDLPDDHPAVFPYLPEDHPLKLALAPVVAARPVDAAAEMRSEMPPEPQSDAFDHHE